MVVHSRTSDLGLNRSAHAKIDGMEGYQALADEHGIFSTAEALRAGMTTRELGLLARGRVIERVARGWYALATVLDDLGDHPAERLRRRHALSTRAMLRAFDGRAVASHHSNLVLNDLPVYAADLRTTHLTRVADDHTRRRKALTIHAQVVGAAHDGLLIEPAVAIIQTGMLNGTMAALVAADAAAHRGTLSKSDLARAAALFAQVDKAAPVLRALEDVDGRAESPGETRLRVAVRMMGVAVTPQQVILGPDGFRAVVDLGVDGERVAIEFDGFVKYGRPNPAWGQQTPADVVVGEKRREDRLRALGYIVVRVTWDELDNLPALKARIFRAIELSRLTRVA